MGRANLELSYHVSKINSKRCLYNMRSKSDWLFNSQSIVLQADWFILENNGKATLKINMPYWRTLEVCLVSVVVF